MLDKQVSVNAKSAGLLRPLRWCPFWAKLLIVSLLLPTELSVSLGQLRLSPYRLVLLVAFIPCLSALLSARHVQPKLFDYLVMFGGFWGFVVYGYHHGFSVSLESGGVRTLELVGAYLIARATIYDERSYRGAVAWLLLVISIMAPLTIIESVSGYHFFHNVASAITGQSFSSPIEKRMGLHRAYGPFDHPILYGVFAASLLGLAWFRAWPALGHPKARGGSRFAAFVAAGTSVSSGAILALVAQLILILWRQLTMGVGSKWKILFSVFIGIYLVIGSISNRPAINVLLSYMTFSPGTAFNRMIIFEWGIQDVWRNPWVGIGFNQWTRPEWMHSLSMDNFWLVQAVTFGIPGFLTVFIPMLLITATGWQRQGKRKTLLRTGWCISMLGMVFAGTSVHFWNSLFCYFMFLLGLGAWFVESKAK